MCVDKRGEEEGLTAAGGSTSLDPKRNEFRCGIRSDTEYVPMRNVIMLLCYCAIVLSYLL